jgi:glycine C-acetyltransferase
VHASIVDGIRLCKAMHDTYKHCDMGHLEEKLQEHQDKRVRLVITDGVFSMDGDFAPLDEIAALAEEYNAMVFLDDSHASGFIGRTGRGARHFGVMGKIDIITTTLGKALGGASGGCVSGRKEIVELCRQKARPYLFSNAVPPPIAASAIKVLEILSATTERRDKLDVNAKFWRKGLIDAGFVIKDGESPIVPVMLFNAKLAQDVARDLYYEGIYVVGFFFPVVAAGQARIRTHTADHASISRALGRSKVGAKYRNLRLDKRIIAKADNSRTGLGLGLVRLISRSIGAAARSRELCRPAPAGALIPAHTMADAASFICLTMLRRRRAVASASPGV